MNFILFNRKIINLDQVILAELDADGDLTITLAGTEPEIFQGEDAQAVWKMMTHDVKRSDVRP